MNRLLKNYTNQTTDYIKTINVIEDKYTKCISVNDNIDRYYAEGIKPRKRLKVTSYEVN